MSSELRKVIKEYVSNNVDKKYKKDKDEEFRGYLEKKIYDDIIIEIIKTEKVKLRKEVKKEIDKEQVRTQIKFAKTIIIETVIVGIIIGLLVNQSTEVISHLKGKDGIILNYTGFWILALLLILVALLVYILVCQVKSLLCESD